MVLRGKYAASQLFALTPGFASAENYRLSFVPFKFPDHFGAVEKSIIFLLRVNRSYGIYPFGRKLKIEDIMEKEISEGIPFSWMKIRIFSEKIEPIHFHRAVSGFIRAHQFDQRFFALIYGVTANRNP